MSFAPYFSDFVRPSLFRAPSSNLLKGPYVASALLTRFLILHFSGAGGLRSVKEHTVKRDRLALFFHLCEGGSCPPHAAIVLGLPSSFLFTVSARTIRGDSPPVTHSCQSTSSDVKAN
jgi:hypothetical protein